MSAGSCPETHDPDGHEVRFYTTGHHTKPGDADVLVVEDPIGTQAQREQAHRGSTAPGRERGEGGRSSSIR